MKRLRSQPRISGITREPSSTSLLPEINAELKRIARENGVSPSWVRATILADALKIKAQPRYYMSVVKSRRRA
jgi:hypothetical protein